MEVQPRSQGLSSSRPFQPRSQGLSSSPPNAIREERPWERG